MDIKKQDCIVNMQSFFGFISVSFMYFQLMKCYTLKYDTVGGEKMDTKQLTVTEALKFARHDFLNELQLILLYIDLDNKEEARKAILGATERQRSMAMLERLRMPSVEEWLNTFDWVHTEFSKRIECDIVAAVDRAVDDRAVADYLETVVQSVAAVLNPLDDHELIIHVSATDSQWSIQMELEETVPVICPAITGNLDITITETADDGQWTFTISGR